MVYQVAIQLKDTYKSGAAGRAGVNRALVEMGSLRGIDVAVDYVFERSDLVDRVVLSCRRQEGIADVDFVATEFLRYIGRRYVQSVN